MKKKFTVESVKQEALKYRTKKEFFTNSAGHYAAAKRYKILSQICAHMETRTAPNKKWDIDTLKIIAQKYKDRISFKQNEYQAYRAAIKNGLLDSICSHMNILKHKWTKKSLANEAKKYNSKIDFLKNNQSAYIIASRMHILDKICIHMNVIWSKKWTIQKNIVKEALKYNTREKFQKESNGAYNSARFKNILDEVCAHMKLSQNTSPNEQELFNLIKQKFPKTQKLRDRKINIPDKPHIKGFDIDIYIPELRKGIEFDGNYWHSKPGLKRGRPNWPNEDIENHLQIKDDYFKSKGIEILHIKEKDWLENKNLYLENAWAFLDRANGRR